MHTPAKIECGVLCAGAKSAVVSPGGVVVVMVAYVVVRAWTSCVSRAFPSSRARARYCGLYGEQYVWPLIGCIVGKKNS